MLQVYWKLILLILQPIDPHEPIKPFSADWSFSANRSGLPDGLNSTTSFILYHDSVNRDKGLAPEEQPAGFFSCNKLGKWSIALNVLAKMLFLFFKSGQEIRKKVCLLVKLLWMGRSKETVQQGVSPNKDLVTLQEYDGWGRKANTWLPAVTTQNTDFISVVSCGELHNTYGGDAYPYLTLPTKIPLEKVIKQHNRGVWRKWQIIENRWVRYRWYDTFRLFRFSIDQWARSIKY